LNDALGITSVVVTHDVYESLKIVDYLYFVSEGKIVAEGSPDELKRLVPGGYIRLEFADPAELDKAARTLGGSSRDDEALTLLVPSDGGVGSLRSLLDRLDDESIVVGGISVQTPDLDDVFLSLTGRAGEQRAVAP
jgi:ABC-2 type transport system ATP-binding protein